MADDPMSDSIHPAEHYVAGIPAGPIEQVILQPTPFCNINCTYCYLPDRSNTSVMPLSTVVQATRVLADSGMMADDVEFVWHAGEPLVVPQQFYRDAMTAIVEHAPTGTKIRHSLQTNGTLIDDEWLRFFSETNMRVGLSLDGPEELHDRHRLTRQGKGTHARVIRAARGLVENEIEFDVICVLTAKSLDYPDEIYEFFTNVGARSVGFNIEETEGSHESQSLRDNSFLTRYREFMERLFVAQQDGRLRIREFEQIEKAIRLGRGDRKSLIVTPLSILTIDCYGNVGTFSPELLGMPHAEYGNFSIGNICEQSIAEMLDSPALRRIAVEITAGVVMCRDTCPYFILCGGGAPVNKLFENGSFRSTETAYCITRLKNIVDIVLPHLETQQTKAE